MAFYKKLTKAIGDYTRGFASEHDSSGNLNHFRTERQNMDPVLKHIKMRTEQVNEAPKVGNRNDWHYAGSI